MKEYEKWLSDPYFDSETRLELESIKDNKSEIEDRFYKELEFGTGGIRGKIGAGINRINKYTIRKATQGLANLIKKNGTEAVNRGVVIAHDPRHMSKEFTLEAALVLANNGIKSYVFNDLRPTPELSFAIRYLNAMAGIVITASHNPPEYNGYKVYWEDGAQMANKLTQEVSNEINKIDSLHGILPMEKEKALELGLLEYIGDEVDDAYIEAVKGQSLRPEVIEKLGRDFKIVYTPLHGTGNIPIRRVLKEIGFENVFVVPEQEKPDPEFSTVNYPNPEERAAFQLSIELAMKENADLIIGTDPDCDRVGAVVKNMEGEYIVLTGNQTGALLVEYILSTLDEKDNLKEDGIVIKTIVTSEMGADIAKAYDIAVLDTLTGFKYIGEKIKEFEKTGEHTFIFGYEESYGYLSGTYTRDKDAVVSSMLICEMAAYYKSRGLTLYEGLLELYEKYGYYLEDLKSITLEGRAGSEKIQSILNGLRENPPTHMGGYEIIKIEDFLKQDKLPKANVLKLHIEGDSWMALRPSGTEPKLKIYCGVKDISLEKSRTKLDVLINAMLKEMS